MNITKWVADFRKSQFWDYAFVPLRFPGAVVHTLSDWFAYREQEQARLKHCRTVNFTPMSDPWLPNGQQH